MTKDIAGGRRVALVHDWLTGMRGGEKCLEVLCELFPDAPIFTLLYNRGTSSPTIARHDIHTSFVQHLPFASEGYRRYLPLFPFAIERFDLAEFDLVVSSSHCVAKAVRTPTEALHICYCHTPMRYIWNQYDEYFGPGKAGILTRLAMSSVVGRLRRWDVATATRPDYYIANSHNVKARIKSIYGRDAEVIYPPVNVAGVEASLTDDGYYLMVTALVPYKKVDIAIEAFNRLKQRLIIVGSGPDAVRLRELAGPTIEFRGWVADAEVHALYAGCTALIFPGEEDFGIVPVEAMAHGKPVIAYAKGGALETVKETHGAETGILFGKLSSDALIEAMERCAQRKFDPFAIRAQVLSFDRDEYKARMARFIEARLSPRFAGSD